MSYVRHELRCKRCFSMVLLQNAYNFPCHLSLKFQRKCFWTFTDMPQPLRTVLLASKGALDKIFRWKQLDAYRIIINHRQ